MQDNKAFIKVTKNKGVALGKDEEKNKNKRSPHSKRLGRKKQESDQKKSQRLLEKWAETKRDHAAKLAGEKLRNRKPKITDQAGKL